MAVNSVSSKENIEIMAPVGSYESLAAAIQGGAGSVYFGVGQLNMRSRSSANFTYDDLDRIVEIARSEGVKTYLTVNTIIYDEELETMRELLGRAAKAGVDAVIVSDQAVLNHARSLGLEIHLSTQLNISNLESVRFYSGWADVMVLARELTLEQVKNIHKGIIRENITGPGGEPVRIELFAHGALCMAVSGRCYLSCHDSGSSANKGACRQICRRSFRLKDRDTGEELVSEGQYLLSPKDLCTIGFLDKVIDAGVRVLKIEGRARSADYVKTVCRCYREAADAVADGSYSADKIREWERRLSEVFNREFWGGYYLGKPVVELSRNYGSSATKRRVYVGKVTNFFKNISVAEVTVEASELPEGQRVIITGDTTGVAEMTIEGLHIEDRPVEKAVQGDKCSFKVGELIRRGDKLYKIVDADTVKTQ